MIALLIGYETVVRLLSPVHTNFGDAIPIAGHSHGHDHSCVPRALRFNISRGQVSYYEPMSLRTAFGQTEIFANFTVRPMPMRGTLAPPPPYKLQTN